MKAIEMITDGRGLTMLSLVAGHAFVGNHTDHTLGLEPDKRYAIMAFELTEGYRLATEEDRKGDIPTGAKYLRGLGGGWSGVAFEGCCFSKDRIYAVPIQTAKDKKREAVNARIKEAEAMLAAARKELESV